jgi:hypothetical protein
MRMMLTPVDANPWRMAARIGSAPRSSGSTDAWMLSVPSGGRSITAFGRMCP